MIRGIPRESCHEQKLTEYFQEAYPTFHITHLTLVYNIAVLQHVYKRRFDRFFCFVLFDRFLFVISANSIFEFGKKVNECSKQPANDLLFTITNVVNYAE